MTSAWWTDDSWRRLEYSMFEYHGTLLLQSPRNPWDLGYFGGFSRKHPIRICDFLNVVCKDHCFLIYPEAPLSPGRIQLPVTLPWDSISGLCILFPISVREFGPKGESHFTIRGVCQDHECWREIAGRHNKAREERRWRSSLWSWCSWGGPRPDVPIEPITEYLSFIWPVSKGRVSSRSLSSRFENQWNYSFSYCSNPVWYSTSLWRGRSHRYR